MRFLAGALVPVNGRERRELCVVNKVRVDV